VEVLHAYGRRPIGTTSEKRRVSGGRVCEEVEGQQAQYGSTAMVHSANRRNRVTSSGLAGLLIALLIATVAACGDDDDDSVASTSASPETAPPQTAPPQTAPPQTTSPQTTSPQTTSPQTTSPQTTSPQTTSPQTTSPQTTSPQTSFHLGFELDLHGEIGLADQYSVYVTIDGTEYPTGFCGFGDASSRCSSDGIYTTDFPAVRAGAEVTWEFRGRADLTEFEFAQGGIASMAAGRNVVVLCTDNGTENQRPLCQQSS
jgi:hypothetical protein